MAKGSVFVEIALLLEVKVPYQITSNTAISLCHYFLPTGAKIVPCHSCQLGTYHIEIVGKQILTPPPPQGDEAISMVLYLN